MNESRVYVVRIGDRFSQSVRAYDARAAANSLAGYWKAQQHRVEVIVSSTGELVPEELWR